MTVLVLQHVAIEGPYHVADACTDAGLPIEVRHVWAGEPVPADASAYQAIVVMGGPMSAYSDEGFPSRRAELALLAGAVASPVPTLGICLGAQLLAVAADGKARPGHGLEIGWGSVRLTPEAADDPLFTGLPDSADVLHWHGDTMDLPAGATRLASSAQYPNQAFRIGRLAWGLQFHLEVTAAAVDRFCAAFAQDALAGGGAEAIRTATPTALATLEPLRRKVLGRFASVAVSAAG